MTVTNFSVIVISDIGQNFLACLQHTFHNPSFIIPEIVTFEGVLIFDAWTYRQHLTPGLHLIIYFPLAIPGDSQSPEGPLEEGPLTLEWVQDLGSPFTNVDEGSPSQPSTIDPAQISLTNIHPHAGMHHRVQTRSRGAEKLLHFQPPSLSFYPLSKVPIAVTFANSLIRKAAYCSIKPDDNGEVVTAEVAHCCATTTAVSDTPGFYDMFPFMQSQDRGWLSGNENGGVSSAPQARDILSYGKSILPQPVAEGTFPLTTFDVFAQGNRSQIVSSVAWDAIAHPSGELSLENGPQQASEISWDLGDVMNPKVSAAARRVHWVNYVPPRKFVGNQCDESLQIDSLQYTRFTSSSTASRRKSGRFWMLHPPRLLPTAFFPTERQMGSEDIHFYVPQPNQLLSFFSRAYGALGFPEGKMTEIIHYWQKLIPTIEARGPNGVVVKFLTHKEVSKIFPVAIEPMPADFLRAFAVAWTLRSNTTWEKEQPGVEEAKLRKVVEGICSHGKSPLGVSLDGFRVFEWGGLVAPYEEGEIIEGKDDDDGSESKSGSDTASDRTIRAASSSFEEEDVLMEDVSVSTDADEGPDTPMGNDVDAVVLGEEGMYIVMRS